MKNMELYKKVIPFLLLSGIWTHHSFAQQQLFINGNAANPELYIQHGPTGFIYVEGGLSAVNNSGATGTPDIVVNGGLFIYKQSAAAGSEGDIINNTSNTLIFDYNRATTATTTDLTGVLPVIAVTSPGVTNGLGGTVHMMTGTQEFNSPTTKDITFYNLSLEGTGNTQKNITTNGITINVGVSSGLSGNTGKLFLNDEYFNSKASNVWIRNSTNTAIERDPLGDGTTGTTGMLISDQNPANTYGMVTSTGQGRLRWTTNAATSYLFPVGSDDMSLYRPVGIMTADATSYSVRLNKGNPNRWVMGTAAPNGTSAVFYALINAEASTSTNDQIRLYGVYNDLQNVTGGVCTLTDVLPDVGMAQNEQNVAQKWGFQPATATAPLTTNNLFYVTSVGFPFTGNISGCSSTVNTARTNYQTWGTFAGSDQQNEDFVLASRPDFCLTQTNGCTPLPVELISFWGEKENTFKRLLWKTASEQNTQWHIIERSDGNTAFAEIGRKPAAGFSNNVLNYSLLDELPLADSYYRLKTVDFDGKFQYSKIIEIKREISNVFAFQSVYPNPGNNIVNIDFTVPSDQLVGFKLYDELGQIVHDETIQTSAGHNHTQIDLRNFSSSMLLLVLNNGEDNIYKKILKLK